MADSTLYIGNINAGSLRTEFVQSLIQAQSHPDIEGLGVKLEGFLLQSCGPYLDDGRNRVIEAFMATDAEWLLFVDSDIAFAPRDLARLVVWAREKPETRAISSGCYFSPQGGKFYTVAYRLDGGNASGPYVAIESSEITARRTPTKVDAVGAGFMLLHRGMLEHFATVFAPPQPWFAEVVTSLDDGTPVHMGEDLTFCARAQSLGYPIWLHRAVRLTHYKTVGLTHESTAHG